MKKYGIIKKSNNMYGACIQKRRGSIREIPKGTLVEVVRIIKYDDGKLTDVVVKETKPLRDAGFIIPEQTLDISEVMLLN